MTDDEQHDPTALRGLAAAIVQNAMHYATTTAADVTDREREDARKFLLDPEDRRLDWWCGVIDVEPEAIRSALRDRLRGRLRQRGDRAA